MEIPATSYCILKNHFGTIRFPDYFTRKEGKVAFRGIKCLSQLASYLSLLHTVRISNVAYVCTIKQN